MSLVRGRPGDEDRKWSAGSTCLSACDLLSCRLRVNAFIIVVYSPYRFCMLSRLSFASTVSGCNCL